MPKASEIAAELRLIADVFDRNPDTVVKKPILDFWYTTDKSTFIDLVRIMPRPLIKKWPAGTGEYERILITHEADAVDVQTTIYQSALGTMIEPARPAKYEWDPLLLADSTEVNDGL